MIGSASAVIEIALSDNGLSGWERIVKCVRTANWFEPENMSDFKHVEFFNSMNLNEALNSS